MAADILSNLDYFHGLSYIGIFIALLLSGHIVPIPQDVSLVLLGYLVAHGYSTSFVMVVIGVLAAIVGDGTLYYLAKKGTSFGQKIESKISNRIFEFVKDRMVRHTFLTIFCMRFFPGLRFTSAVVSGYVAIPWKKFLLYNGFSACIYVPFYFFLGYLLEDKISTVITIVDSARHIIIAFLAFVLCFVVGTVIYRTYRKRAS